ncbi:MAG: AI-2E family transporter [Erysipelotrichaceae bacterium]|nr:AI-2E family transporter [Erysipelotrichaceae bacterium]
MDFTKKIKDLDVRGLIRLISIVIIMILILVYFKNIVDIIINIFDVLIPVFIGIALAFIFNMPMSYYERKLPIKNNKTKKIIAAILAIATVLIFVVIVLVAVIPQIIENLSMFINNSSSLLDGLWSQIQDILIYFNLSSDMLITVEPYESNITDTVLELLRNFFPDILILIKQLSSGIVDFVIGFIMSIYILLYKNMLIRQMDKLTRAIFKEKQYEWLKDFEILVARCFGDFLFGQLKEAIIIGVLCYIGCIILNIPYGLICSLVIGVTNVIPYFGPFIGAIIDCLIIFSVDPFQAIVFLIFSTCLQQFESHVIYPQVIGRSIGLSPLWVLLAVVVGGELFGIVGMVIGLPTFAVIYELVRRWTNHRLSNANK